MARVLISMPEDFWMKSMLSQAMKIVHVLN